LSPKPVEGPPNPVEAVNRGSNAGNLGEPNPGINRVDTPQAPEAPQVNPAEGPAGKQPVQGPKKWDTVKTDNGLRKGVDPGITRGDTTPQFNQGGSTGPKKWEPVRTDSGLRKGVDPGITRGDTPPQFNQGGSTGPKKWEPVRTDAGLRKGVDPGVTRGDTPPRFNPKGKQPVQAARKWDAVKTDGGLRHEISPGALTDEASGYNKMAVKQEFYGVKDGKPVPGRNKLPDLGGHVWDKFDANHPPPQFEEFGTEMTKAVDGAMDDIIQHAKKGEKGMWRRLKPHVAKPESGFTKVMSAISKTWEALWDAIFEPFKLLWEAIKTLAAKIAKWFGHVSEGTTMISRVAAGFSKVFAAVRATKAWRVVAEVGSKSVKWIAKWAPKILKHGCKWVGRAVSVVGWVTLVFDVVFSPLTLLLLKT
jgi:hypothetical protein